MQKQAHSRTFRKRDFQDDEATEVGGGHTSDDEYEGEGEKVKEKSKKKATKGGKSRRSSRRTSRSSRSTPKYPPMMHAEPTGQHTSYHALLSSVMMKHSLLYDHGYDIVLVDADKDRKERSWTSKMVDEFVGYLRNDQAPGMLYFEDLTLTVYCYQLTYMIVIACSGIAYAYAIAIPCFGIAYAYAIPCSDLLHTCPLFPLVVLGELHLCMHCFFLD